MEAKRRKLSPSASPGSSGSGKPRSSTSSPDAQKKPVTREQLKSDDPTTQAAALKTLKKQISTKAAVMGFMDSNEPNGRFFAVVDVLGKMVAELDTEECESPSPLLKDVIGILANCCYYSTAACLEMKSTHIRFNYLAVKLYNSPKLSEDCTFSLTRLVANMCAHKETALSISSCSALVETISKLLDSDHIATSVQALRCIKLLVQSSFIRAVLFANAGFYLGKVVSKRGGKQLQDAIALLQTMCQRYVRDVGRQLANSECVTTLLAFYFAKDEKAQSLVIRLSGGSSDIRDALGEATVIQRIVEESNKEKPDSGSCALLATFSHDAWGRAALRTSGALDILVKRLSVSQSESERMSLVLSFKHFVHDTAGMAHLAASRLFVDTVAQDVLKYLEKNGTACKPQLQSNEDVFRPDSPLLMEIETNLRQKTTDEEREQRLHKDYFSLWAYSSPSPAISHISSHSYSAPSSGAGSPVQSSPMSSPMSAGTSYESNHEKRRAASATDDWEDDSGSGMSERGRICQTIIDSELWLIAWQAQEDSNLPHLIRPDLVNALIDYLSLAPKADFRVGRALKRMASFRISIDRLLRIQFHTRIFTSLCGAPCRLARNAKRCARCERCADFGREVLREFSSNVDSDFGYAYLQQEFAKKDFLDNTKAAIAKVALIKNRGRAIRTLNITHQAAVNMLFDGLKTLLEKEDFDTVVKESTYPDGPPLAAQIIGALSTLVPQNKIREIFDVDATFVPSERVQCRISADQSLLEKDSTELLSFEENGVILASIPVEAACKNSGYFEGMFASTWKETKSGQRTFPFNAATENCSSADFTRFLHYLAGCRDECTRVDTPVTLLALIQLSDRYLCATLGSWLCSPHGPLSRLLTGDSLHFLLPAALTANMHPRFLSSCLATLMRYANGEDVVCALIAINSTPMLIDMFLSNLRLFVTGAAAP